MFHALAIILFVVIMVSALGSSAPARAGKKLDCGGCPYLRNGKCHEPDGCEGGAPMARVSGRYTYEEISEGKVP